MLCKDDEFYEQLENAGYEELLDVIYEALDEDMKGLDYAKIGEMSKAVLIMDMLKCCIDSLCHFAFDSGAVQCGKEYRKMGADDSETYKAK